MVSTMPSVNERSFLSSLTFDLVQQPEAPSAAIAVSIAIFRPLFGQLRLQAPPRSLTGQSQERVLPASSAPPPSPQVAVRLLKPLPLRQLLSSQPGVSFFSLLLQTVRPPAAMATPQPEMEQPEMEQPEMEQPKMEQPEMEQPEMEPRYLAESNAAINSQIQLQLYAAYIYLSMAFFCNQDEVALVNFALYFLCQSQKWMESTEKLFHFLIQRNGSLVLGRIADQQRHDWCDGLMAMECALHLEKTLNQSLLQLYQLANSKGDACFCSFLKRHFLQQQVEIIKEMGGYVTNLRQLGAPGNRLAEHFFDRLTLGESTKEN